MKIIPAVLLGASLTLAGLTSQAQKIELAKGNLASILKGQTSINVQYTYDHMSVGKYDREQDYVSDRTATYNKKEAGRGDAWAKAWVGDRAQKFEPKFEELFNENSDFQITKDNSSKYTLIFHTTSTEPGYNVGVMRKNARIDAEVLLVETANPDKVLARITVEDAPGRTFGGYDFDTGGRISECYAVSGKKLAKFINKKAKKA
ncbi:hypothetical protein CLV59_101338 [Chitinophaga dinghuensis]|uniref:Uncharacterized protein n=1 Tax=Chitinophaga dinghuensis TaxID=1539050 RepID=A0A327WDZ0_9BACT|nr:hypothetical protein [Chitinophaga dinghuensis]RAJ87580.1 hypothetical protein CLV59_101338 [Chitinophaga dinghuensis]